MRSGLVGDAGSGEGLDETLARLLVLVLILSDDAKDLATKLAEHAGAAAVRIDHVDMAMKALVYRGKFFEDASVETRLHARMAEIFGGSSDSSSGLDTESESETESETEESSGTPEEEEMQSAGEETVCLCAQCDWARTATEAWGAWQPEDEVLQFLKKHYDDAAASVAVS